MGEAFSTGLGMTMGLLMGQYMVQAMTLRKIVVKEVVICQQCAARNPIEYTYCSNCGQGLYPPKNTCQQCKVTSPAIWIFCGNCGVPLKGAVLIKNH